MRKARRISLPVANTLRRWRNSTPKLTPGSSRRCREVSRAGTSSWKCYEQLPQRAQELADKNFALFKENPHHPSLGFKKKGGVHTVEVGRSYRALARKRHDEYYWFWIGTHEAYNNFRF